jgi:hypothetical protein
MCNEMLFYLLPIKKPPDISIGRLITGKNRLKQFPALWIRAPRFGHADGTRPYHTASAQIGLELCRISTVNVLIAGKVSFAGKSVAAGICQVAPAKILLEV